MPTSRYAKRPGSKVGRGAPGKPMRSAAKPLSRPSGKVRVMKPSTGVAAYGIAKPGAAGGQAQKRQARHGAKGRTVAKPARKQMQAKRKALRKGAKAKPSARSFQRFM